MPYTALYLHPRGVLRSELVTCLRRKSRIRKSHILLRGHIIDMNSIHSFTPTMEDRIVPGHWEGDLINEENNRCCVGLLFERTSRFILLAKMDNSGTVPFLSSFSATLNTALSAIHAATLSNSCYEPQNYNNLIEQPGVQIYLADPRAHDQLKPSENISALLRQYIPTESNISICSQNELDAIAYSLNTRPRLTLGWKTPLAVYAEYMSRLYFQPELLSLLNMGLFE